jgi:hypothetical protein
VPDNNPASEDLVELPVEDRLVNERGRRQHRGALDGLLSERDITRIEV